MLNVAQSLAERGETDEIQTLIDEALATPRENRGGQEFAYLMASSRLLKKGVSVKLPCRWSQEHDDVRL